MADSAEPADAPIGKIQVHLNLGASKKTWSIVGKKQEKLNLDYATFSNVPGALYIARCEDCEFTFTGTCNKILVDSCKNTKLTVNGHVITNVFEICKCSDFDLVIDTRIATLQADMCRKLRIEFTKQHHYKQLVWAAVHDLSLTFRDNAEHRLSTGFTEMRASMPALTETDQFTVRFVGGSLLQEPVLRLAGGYPSTERERRFFDAEAKKRDEHMREQAERMVRFVPRASAKQGATPPPPPSVPSLALAPRGSAARTHDSAPAAPVPPKSRAEQGADAPVATPKPNTVSILALGDSLTEGLVRWGMNFQPYTALLPAMLAPCLADGWAVDVVNLGVSGETSAQISRRAPYSGNWSVVVLLAGTNDLGTREADIIFGNLRDMYANFERTNTIVVAVTAPHARIKAQPAWLIERRDKLNDLIRAWTKEKPDRRILVDLFAEMKIDDEHASLWAPDGLHFSVEGYKLFGSLVAAALSSSPVTAGQPWRKNAATSGAR